MDKQKHTIMPPSNGSTTQSRYPNIKPFEEKLHTFLLSVVTAGVIGCFAFLWNMNKSIALLEDHDTDNIKSRAEQNIRINTIQLDIRDIRERVIKIEAQNQKQ